MLHQIEEFITRIVMAWMGTMEESGYWGIGVLMAIESSVIPLPSEVVMLPAGVLVAQGKMNLWLAILAGTVGSLVGSLANYFLATWLGRAFLWRYGKYFFLPVDKLEWAEEEWKKHGEITTFVCRLLPVLRHLISIPAGLARMPLGKFCWWTTTGAGIWVTILTVAGYYLGERAEELWASHKREITIGLFATGFAVIGLYFSRNWLKRTFLQRGTARANPETIAGEANSSSTSDRDG